MQFIGITLPSEEFRDATRHVQQCQMNVLLFLKPFYYLVEQLYILRNIFQIFIELYFPRYDPPFYPKTEL